MNATQTQTPDFAGVDALANSVMRAVAASGVVTEAKIGLAVEVMRAEIKALFYGPEYADERACILAGSLSQQTVLLSVVASCVTKIREG